jgi:hypothetical protein
MRSLRTIFALLVCLPAILAACGEETAKDQQVGTLSGGTGKADGIAYEIKDFFRHNRYLPIDDLMGQLAELATDELNDQLSIIPFADIRISDAQVYSVDGESLDFVETRSLAQLTTDLLSRFGANSFSAKLNDIRTRHLQFTDDSVYAEAQFKVDLGHDFHFSVSPGDVDVRFGFLPNQQLVSRTVSAHKGSLPALVQAPLESVKQARGFILPTKLDDVLSMKPGEAVTLEGTGVIGFNVGANIPIFSFDPVSVFFVTTRVSIGGRVLLNGRIDCQVIRGEQDDAWLEVGISDWTIKGLNVGLANGYGLMGLPDLAAVDVFGKEYVLGEIAEDLLNNYMRKKGWFSVGVSYSSESQKQRMTVERFRFRLNRGEGEVGEALVQGLGGDLRLAQTLADREYGAVEQVISFTRDIDTHRSRFGAHVSSMKFFSENMETTGAVTIVNGDSMQKLLLEEIQHSEGKFFTDWKYRRVLARSEEWVDGVPVSADTNLRLAVSEADKFTARDQVLDHVDAALLSVFDFETLYYTLTEEYERLQHEVDKYCTECDDRDDWSCENEYDKCVDDLIKPEEVEDWKGGLWDLNLAVLPTVDDTPYHDNFVQASELASQLLDLKLALCSVKEVAALFSDTTGRTSLLTDFRISMAGLDRLFEEVTPEQFEDRLAQVLMLIVAKRSKATDDKYKKAVKKVESSQGNLHEMRKLYAEIRDEYRKLGEISRVTVDGQAIGGRAMTIVPFLDGKKEKLTMLTLADRKGLLAAQLYDDLLDAAEDYDLLDWVAELFTLGLADPLGFESQHLVNYTLLSLVPAEEREVLLSMDFEEDGFADVSAYLRGQDAEFIGAGQFDLDALLSP